MLKNVVAWIRVISPVDAGEPLSSVYASILGKPIANILQTQSLDPEGLRHHYALYRHLMYAAASLSRTQREMIAVAVSVANGCEYWIEHHCAALRTVSRDERLVQAIRDNDHRGLNAQDQALVRYAKLLTSSPKSVANADIVALRTAGFDDESILLAAEIIAYFNFVNRLAQGLGTQLELPWH